MSGYVYFIKPVGLPGPIKIGCSKQPESRRSSFEIWSPWPLEIVVEIPGDCRLEAALHRRFAAHHSHREWFHASPEILSVAEQLKSGTPIGEIIDLSDRSGKARRLPISEEARMRKAYAMQIHWAEKRLKRQTGEIRCCPQDIDLIFAMWRGCRDQQKAHPTDEQIARVEEVIANPELHLITLAEKYPSARAA
jgi:hypothetical protein